MSDIGDTAKKINEYLDTRHHSKTEVVGEQGPNARVVVKSQYDFTLREIICNLLAGRGLKLPNVQVCLSVNIKAILGVPDLQAELKDALAELDKEFDQFMEHTSIESVLGRINDAIAEVTQVANMVNFCAKPIIPLNITKVLEETMGSFLGAGKRLINDIGNMIPNRVGGCLSFNGQDFNVQLFQGGILGDLGAVWDRARRGALNSNELNAFVARVNRATTALSDLRAKESRVRGTSSLGGSQFEGDASREVNTGLGVLHNAEASGIQGNTRVASQLKASYDRLAGYPVIDENGQVYKNIFELFLEPGLIDLLDRLVDPSPDVSERQPVFNYCGEIVGYTQAFSQTSGEVSNGLEPGSPNEDGSVVDITTLPGYNAGGFDTTDDTEGGTGTSTTIINQNNTTITGNTVRIVGTESSQLALATSTGDIVVRSDLTASFVRNTNTTGTLADYTAMNTPLSNFLNSANQLSTNGLLVKDGDFAVTRLITGVADQTYVLNANGGGGNVVVGLTENAKIYGTGSLKIPAGTSAQRVRNNIGEIRYNTTSNVYEAYYGGPGAGWKSIATGTSSVTDGANVGTGLGIYFQNNNGTLEFKSLAAAGAVSLSTNLQNIVIGDSLTVSNVGATGTGLYKQRAGNDLQFKKIAGVNNVSVTEISDTLFISGDTNIKYSTVTTNDGTPTEVLFSGARLSPSANNTWFVTITAVGRGDSSSGNFSAKLEGMLDNTTGTITLVSNQHNKVIFSNSVGSSWNLDAYVSGNEFKIFVTGGAGVTAQWRIKVEILPAI